MRSYRRRVLAEDIGFRDPRDWSRVQRKWEREWRRAFFGPGSLRRERGRLARLLRNAEIVLAEAIKSMAMDSFQDMEEVKRNARLVAKRLVRVTSYLLAPGRFDEYEVVRDAMDELSDNMSDAHRAFISGDSKRFIRAIDAAIDDLGVIRGLVRVMPD